MKKNAENSNHLMIKNYSTNNLYFSQKNKSPPNISQNTKNRDKIHKIEYFPNKNEPSNHQIKDSSRCHSSTRSNQNLPTSRVVISNNNSNIKKEESGNILVKKNIKLGLTKKNSPNKNIDLKGASDKNKFALSNTSPPSKNLSKYGKISLINTNNNSKKDLDFNYINYHNYKKGIIKKKELTVITKANISYRNNVSNNADSKVNSFLVQNLPTSPNISNHAQSYFSNIAKNNYYKKTCLITANKSKDKNNELNTTSKNNDESKDIFGTKANKSRHKYYTGKKQETDTTCQSSISSKLKKDKYNSIDSTLINEIYNNNTPEELHFYYIQMLQNGKDIERNF
jgi:hypothetical protein